MSVLGNIRGQSPIFRHLLRNFSPASGSRASNAFIRRYNCSNVVRIEYPVKLTPQVSRTGPSRVPINRLMTTRICQVIKSRFHVRAPINLARSSNFGASVIKQRLLLRSVDLSNSPSVINLPYRVYYHVVIGPIFLGATISRVAPRCHNRPRLVNVFGHL